MRRLYWMIGVGAALLALVGGLTYLALAARTGSYASGVRPGIGSVEAGEGGGASPSPAPVATAPAAQPAADQTAMAASPVIAAETAQFPAVQLQASVTHAQPEGALRIGMQAVTRPPDARDLWTDEAGGERVFERPKLYGGSLVTIRAIAPNAVQVRTPEGVVGWLHERGELALSEDLTVAGEQAPFVVGARLTIIWPNGIPLRQEPAPDATKVRQQLRAGVEGALQELRGDWVLVELDDGTIGWARWYYDGARYVDVLREPASSPSTSGTISSYLVTGVRVGTADGKRIRVVVDLARTTPDAQPDNLFDAPAAGRVSDMITVLVHASTRDLPSVQYLAGRAQDLVTVTAAAAPDGLAVQMRPSTPLYLREAFYLPRDAPDSPAQYDRVVVDFCYTTDCPALR